LQQNCGTELFYLWFAQIVFHTFLPASIQIYFEHSEKNDGNLYLCITYCLSNFLKWERVEQKLRFPLFLGKICMEGTLRIPNFKILSRVTSSNKAFITINYPKPTENNFLSLKFVVVIGLFNVVLTNFRKSN
jgi:hypothetical protein